MKIGQHAKAGAMIMQIGFQRKIFRGHPARIFPQGSQGRSSRLAPAPMLQRKQTLFLLLAAVCGGLTFLFPVDTFIRGDQSFVFRTTGFFTGDGANVVDAALKVPFAAVLGLLSALLIGLVFLYRNRPRQMRLARMLNLLLIAVQVFLFITDNSVRAYLEQGGRVENHFGLAALLPLVMVLLVLLAIRGIRKDEALVRSMDRLR